MIVVKRFVCLILFLFKIMKRKEIESVLFGIIMLWNDKDCFNLIGIIFVVCIKVFLVCGMVIFGSVGLIGVKFKLVG